MHPYHSGHRPELHQPSSKLLHRQLALNPKFFNPLPQRGPRDAEEFGGLDLVAVGFFEGVDDELAFDGGDNFQGLIGAGPLEEFSG